MEQVIYLTDGNECRVKRLGIFELDQIKPAISEPFTYKMKTLTGQEYDVEFDLASYPAPPVKPDIPEGGLVENTGPWFEYLDWQRYQAAALHLTADDAPLRPQSQRQQEGGLFLRRPQHGGVFRGDALSTLHNVHGAVL